jgi:hypothetical protein
VRSYSLLVRVEGCREGAVPPPAVYGSLLYLQMRMCESVLLIDHIK